MEEYYNSKKQFQDLADSCLNISELASRIGLNVDGRNLSTLRKRIKAMGIDISHFGKTPMERKRLARTVGNTLIFDPNGNKTRISSYTIKRLMLEIGVEYICNAEGCNNTGEWLGQKMTLHVDHINEIRYDNEPKNLQFLCPNCHAVKTSRVRKSKSKKVKSKNFRVRTHERQENGLRCKICSSNLRGEQLFVCSRSCSGILSSKGKSLTHERPNKELLEKLMVANSYSAIGRKYGVSGNAVKKWAKKFGIIRA